MANKYNNYNPAQTLELADSISSTIPPLTPNPYGTSSAQMTALTTAKTALAADITATAAARAAYRAAVEQRDSSQAATTSAIASIAATIFGNPLVTPTMIAATGLVPRSTSRAKVVPTTPINLVANPQPNGQVNLKWGRNGNKMGVVFRVEAKSASGIWMMVTEATGCKVTLTGYTPGIPVYFRVTASKNGIVSGASNEAIIYGASSVDHLTIAA